MQQPSRKLRAAFEPVAVGARERADIGVHVEGAVGHDRHAEAELPQGGQQEVAPLPELLASLLEHFKAVSLETGERRMLGDRRRAQIQVL